MMTAEKKEAGIFAPSAANINYTPSKEKAIARKLRIGYSLIFLLNFPKD